MFFKDTKYIDKVILFQDDAKYGNKINAKFQQYLSWKKCKIVYQEVWTILRLSVYNDTKYSDKNNKFGSMYWYILHIYFSLINDTNDSLHYLKKYDIFCNKCMF